MNVDDWEDLTDNSVFNPSSYSEDSPTGYTDAVDEVFKDQEQ